LIAALAAVAIVAFLAVLYLWILPHRSAQSAAAPAAKMENAGAAAQPANPFAKYLELAGVRITELPGSRARIQMLVVNHSGADLPEMVMDVILTAGGDQIFQFPVKLPSIGPYESRELSSTMKTNLKPYELPDWQVVKSEFRLRMQGQE
jgi:hypothetical protein